MQERRITSLDGFSVCTIKKACSTKLSETGAAADNRQENGDDCSAPSQRAGQKPRSSIQKGMGKVGDLFHERRQTTGDGRLEAMDNRRFTEERATVAAEWILEKQAKQARRRMASP
jgi:hypothetical protein